MAQSVYRGAGRPRFDSQQEKNNFLYSKESKSSLGFYEACYPMRTGKLLPGRGVKLMPDLHLVPSSRMAELHLHFPPFSIM
jgi:hypothetical protein